MTLPEFPHKIGFTFIDDEMFNLPYVQHCTPGSHAYHALPPGMRRNYFLLDINGDSPITSQFVQDTILRIQQSPNRKTTLSFAHRHADNNTTLEIT